MISFLESGLQQWAQHPGAQKLGAALLHFLWQGTLLAAIAMALLLVCRRARPQIRYSALLGLLGLMALAPIVTFSLLQTPAAPIAKSSEEASHVESTLPEPLPPFEPPESAEIRSEPSAVTLIEIDPLPSRETRESSTTPASVEPTAPQSRDEILRELWIAFAARLQAHLHWIVAAWLVGVSSLSLRLLVGLIGAERARRVGVIPVADQIQRAVDRLAARLGIRQRVLVLESTAVEIPTLTGWLRPVILLPASALCGLYPEQLEAIVAHELAHVRRHDYLVNLIQTVIETVLFYHPAVWWLSRRIRQEREHCCDDDAIALCQDRVTYARALASMEELRHAARWVVAARGGSLVERISRLLGRPEPVPAGRPAVLFVALIVSVVLVATWQWRTTLQAGDERKADPNDSAPIAVADSDAEPDASASPPPPLEEKDRDLAAPEKRLEQKQQSEQVAVAETAPPNPSQIVQQLSERISLCIQPDPSVKTLGYDILLGSEANPIRVQRGERRRIGVWQGTTLKGTLQQLLRDPKRFAVELVEDTDGDADVITLKVKPVGDQNIKIEAGNGVENSWRGYFSQGAAESRFRIDARRMVPLEEVTGGTTFRYDQWEEVRPGKWVPKQVEVVRAKAHYRMHFDWLADALWFLRKSESVVGDTITTMTRTQNVRINDQPVEQPLDAEVQKSRDAVREIVALLDHNRPWLDRGTTGSGWQPPFDTLQYSFHTEREDVRELCVLDQNGEALFEVTHDGQGKLKERLGERFISLNGGEYAKSRRDGQFVSIHPRPERRKGIPFDLSLKHYARIGCQLDLPIFEYRDHIENARVEIADGEWNGTPCRKATITDLPGGAYLGCGTMLAFTSWSYVHHIAPMKEVLYFEPQKGILLHETLVDSKRTFEIDFEDYVEVAPDQWAPRAMRIVSPDYFTCEYRFQIVQGKHWMLREVVSWFKPESKSRGVIEDVSMNGPAGASLIEARQQIERTRKLVKGEWPLELPTEKATIPVVPLLFGEAMRHGPMEMRITMPDRNHLELHLSASDTTADLAPVAIFDKHHRLIFATTIELKKAEGGVRSGSMKVPASVAWNEARFVNFPTVESGAKDSVVTFVIPFRWDNAYSINVPELQTNEDGRSPVSAKTRGWKIRAVRGGKGTVEGTVDLLFSGGPHEREYDVSLALLDQKGRLIAAGHRAASVLIKSPPLEESFVIDLGTIPEESEPRHVLLGIIPGRIRAAPLGSTWGMIADTSPTLDVARLLGAGDDSFWRIGLAALGDHELNTSIRQEFEDEPRDERRIGSGPVSRKTLITPHVAALIRLTREVQSPDVVLATTRWLGYSGSPEAVAPLERLLSSNATAVQDAAAIALTFLGSAKHLDDIRRILERDRPTLEESGSDAARRAHDRTEFDALVALAHQRSDAAIDLLGATLLADLERLKPITNNEQRPALEGRLDRADLASRILARCDGERTLHWLTAATGYLDEHPQVSALFNRYPLDQALKRLGTRKP